MLDKLQIPEPFRTTSNNPTALDHPQPELTIHLISHNHWDREWIFTARYTNRWLVPFFANLFRVLDEQPRYRFVLDGQTAIIEDYLSQLTEDEAVKQEKTLRRFVKAGQLLVGPAYLQPDWGLVSGESLVRNLMIGHKMAKRFGGVMKAGWMLDNFGQIAQAPQIYKGFGIDGAFVWRGIDMGSEELKSEFCWQSPDGSAVLAIYLINSYRNAMVLSLTKEIALERIRSEALALRPFATTPNVLLMNGYEQVPWPDDVLPIIDAFNRLSADGFACQQSTPPEYLDAVRAGNPELPTLRGYLYSGRYMPVLKGVFSSRSHLKLLNNECQRELERWAEPFAAIAWTLGADYPQDKLEKAWKTLLLNHAHDDVCGCSIDKIARDMEDRFGQVLRIACDITDDSLKAISNAINTRRTESRSAITIFNPSPRARRDVISFSLELPTDIDSFAITDGHGQPTPYQLVGREENHADLYLYVSEVPPLGYKTYYLIDGIAATDAHPAVWASAENRTLENDFLKVTINADGSLNLTDKQTGQTHDRLGTFEDGGDAGDTYDYSYPEHDALVSSRGQQATITLLEAGPLLARFRVAINMSLPVSLSEDRTRRHQQTRVLPIISYIELTAGSHRVEIKTLLKNVVKDHRLRLLFPSGINADYCYAEEPFDVARLPVASSTAATSLPEKMQKLMLAGRYTAPTNTHPFQNFVDYSDGERGLAIISRRVTEFEILPADGTIALTLLRSVGWLTRYDLLTRIGDVGPYIFTPEAQCLGEHVFHYALYPHSHQWPENKAHLEAFSHNLKLRVVQSHSQGELPDELSFLSLTPQDGANAFRLTALKRAESGDGLIVRFFNTLEQHAQGELRTGWTVSQVSKTNLNEEEEEALPEADANIKIQARQKEIVTLKLTLTPPPPANSQRAAAARVLPPLPLGEKIPDAELPPVITRQEVDAERNRVARLGQALMRAQAEVYTLEDQLERTAARDIARLYELQKKKMEVATLSRQHNESRISALLNRELYITTKIENELEEIGEAMSWSRTKKRAGEYLLHYYEGLLRKQNEPSEPA